MGKGFILPPCQACNGRLQWFKKNGLTVVYRCIECRKLWAWDGYGDWEEVKPSHKGTVNLCPICQMEGENTGKNDMGQFYKCRNGHRFVKKGGVIREWNSSLSGWQKLNQEHKKPASFNRRDLTRRWITEMGFRARIGDGFVSFQNWLKEEEGVIS